MRMRKRHNLDARMEKCAALLISSPEDYRGRWADAFPGYKEIYVELGCGKGRFTVETARSLPEVLFLAVEKVPDAMILAMERTQAAGLQNVRFMDLDAARLSSIFFPGEIQRIYLNFSDPWPKSRDAKFRLTAPGFLRLYADALPLGGDIHFKTDNRALFDWSLEQFRTEGWLLSEVSFDLHKNGPSGVMTDYEAKFVAEGMRIHRLVATRTDDTKTSAAGPLPRLRSAALADARGFHPSEDTELRLTGASLPLCRAFYQHYVPAPELFEDPSEMRPFVYDAAWVEERYASRQRPDRRNLYILLGEEVIGELVLKAIDPAEKSCRLGICLVNDSYKNHGYGTRAERLALRYAFEELGMETVLADSLLGNTRSQHVLLKAGFRYVSEDEHFKYYRVTRDQFLVSGEQEKS